MLSLFRAEHRSPALRDDSVFKFVLIREIRLTPYCNFFHLFTHIEGNDLANINFID